MRLLIYPIKPEETFFENAFNSSFLNSNGPYIIVLNDCQTKIKHFKFTSLHVEGGSSDLVRTSAFKHF